MGFIVCRTMDKLDKLKQTVRWSWVFDIFTQSVCFEILKLENYFSSFMKNKINHKDFQLSATLTFKKKWFSCVIKL
jgi:hypothetical protein